ncbi:quinol dehydrogenase ferredoxin subunit NapH [Laribacter hongkongensis]|uniref:quinol dehydrogenase ferredoxin subunit NapH n=1 Tax=Laribacter hongkongensis TaxID=168471 RepID=UPI001EFE0729|nr:quinol dehydrogenase ferredoxin subunit NapH [Laribacter hongkongensis]MCG9094070.1 quinol dehydrogenase ferredoxin subunit NapH [Laribacter hongkongensis]
MTPKRSFWQRHRWLILRRLSQLSVLGLFAGSGALAGCLGGVWVLKGNLTASRVLDTVPLTDPFVLAQSLAAGHLPQLTALLGAVIVAGFYLVAGGRVFCSWVCPVNLVTDCAGWSRRRLGLKGGRMPPRSLRRWLLAAVLLASAFSGSMVWELVNPVSLLHREILFGAGIGLVLVLAVFIYDLVIAQRGWCGHVCPMGAAYGLIGRASLLRVSAPARARCDDCMDCFAVCPEPQVIKPALKGDAQSSPVILNGDCTNCGRCIDVCAQDVFRFSHRFDKRSEES